MTWKPKLGDRGKTRDGRPYRVIADDAANRFLIVALVCDRSGSEWSISYLPNGSWLENGESGLDLMPPPRTVECERAWMVYRADGELVTFGRAEAGAVARYKNDPRYIIREIPAMEVEVPVGDNAKEPK